MKTNIPDLPQSIKQKNVKQRSKKVISPFLKVALAFLFISALFYLCERAVIPQYIQTSLLTILGGALVVVMGQVVQKWYVEPIHELQKTIGEVRAALLVYANTVDQRVEEDLQKEARRTLRKLSGDLLGKRRVVAHYSFVEGLGLLPPKESINEAATGLVLMSNSVGSHSFDSFDKGVERVKAALWLDE